MPGGGILSICAENIFIDENYARMNIEAKVGRYVVITVSDTAIGIPHKIIDRIFYPFFTTKDSGTGLGLSVVHQIVSQHGGTVTVTRNQDKGMTFSLFFPQSRGDLA